MCGILRRTPNWIFEGNMFGQFYTLREPIITYIPTKFRENILIGAEICYQNITRNGFSSGGILLPVLTMTTVILRGLSNVSLYKISRKSVNARPNTRFNFFSTYHAGVLVCYVFCSCAMGQYVL